jgi:hypothetical protein
MKEVISGYDSVMKVCTSYNDLNYVDYKGTAYLEYAKANNVTAPTSYYLSYVPQKTDNTWIYMEKVCQSNRTMCGNEGGEEYGALDYLLIVGVLFLFCLSCCLKVYCWCKKNKGFFDPD